MVSNSKVSLNDAIAAMEQAYARLSAAADTAVHERNQSAAAREAMQQEISHSWQQTVAEIETALTQAQSENAYLKEDNTRLSNQLAQVQRDYLDLQRDSSSVVGVLDRSVKQLDLILDGAVA